MKKKEKTIALIIQNPFRHKNISDTHTKPKNRNWYLYRVVSCKPKSATQNVNRINNSFHFHKNNYLLHFTMLNYALYLSLAHYS